ncbi:NAD-dependent epimerase/dehydratase family protein [Halocatena pleomorpha]|uniref:NAD-dependent epimerase/dehydratase family protein n=1 Tax=Halocatena pleomorpha TaxID=1785090 RepID=A0A3P3R7E8_9EURY|nr:NAD-dependent epimerase/dehydratase family protein [Halocatena pleomorpha]RRJ28859.1 NAD-dependent epimerase/dehydratase family protein [Halocatena pleomorpha]
MGTDTETDQSHDSVLITGGTGFLGLHTCQYFDDNGWDVVAFDRVPFVESDDVSDIEYVEGDVRDEDAVRSVIDRVEPDVVVHAAAALPLWDADTIRAVTIDGTRSVLWAAQEAGIDRVVYISSTAVYGVHEEHPITESSPLDGVGPYGNAKVQAEKLCGDFRRRGLCVPILRPKTFIGPQRLGVFQVLFDWVEDGANIPLVGWGHNEYQLLHVHDLVRAIELLATADAERVDDTFNVGATEYDTMKSDFQALIDHAGTDKRVVGTPALLTVAALRLLNELNLSPLYPWIYETAHHDSYVSVEKLRDLGWVPEYSNTEALIDTYDWYLDQYEATDTTDTGVDHRVAWDQGALTLVKQVFQAF